MKKVKLILTIVFIVLALACVWAFVAAGIITKNFDKEAVEGANGKQKITISNLIIRESTENEKSWELAADSGSYNSSTKEATLTGIIGNFYDKGEVVASFKAQNAAFYEEIKKIVLNTESLIIYKDGTYIQADRFEWEGNNNTVRAKGHVKIVKPNEAVIMGEEASLSNKMTDFQILGRTTTKLFGEGKI